MDDYLTFKRHELAAVHQAALAQHLEPELRPILDFLRLTNLKQNRLGLALIQEWARGMLALNVEQIDKRTVEFTGFAIPHGDLGGDPRFFVNGERVTDIELHIPNHIDNAIDPEGGRHFGVRFRVKGFDVLNAKERVEIAMASGASWTKPDPYGSLWFGPSADPLPAAANLTRIGGRDGAPEQYLKFGATFIYKLEYLLKQMGYEGFSSFERILDWGCGCGRMLRFFEQADRHRLTGIDIDGQNIAWNRENMGDIQFEQISTDPPTPFENDRFNLIYANSVMTHLTVDDQFAWLEELARIAAPGAIIALTIHGWHSWAILGWQEMNTLMHFKEKGIRVADELNPDIADVPGNRYTDTAHTHDYIYREWGKYFDVHGIVEGFSGTQAMVILQARKAP